MLLVVVLVVAWVAQAIVTMRVAGGRGHDRVLWLVLGLVFPLAALIALHLGFPRTQAKVGELAPDVAEALGRSRVAQALAGHEGMREEDVVAATGIDDGRVAGELRTLRVLGLVRRGRDRTWSLTPRAATALAGRSDEGGDERRGSG